MRSNPTQGDAIAEQSRIVRHSPDRHERSKTGRSQPSIAVIKKYSQGSYRYDPRPSRQHYPWKKATLAKWWNYLSRSHLVSEKIIVETQLESVVRRNRSTSAGHIVSACVQLVSFTIIVRTPFTFHIRLHQATTLRRAQVSSQVAPLAASQASSNTQDGGADVWDDAVLNSAAQATSAVSNHIQALCYDA